VKDRDAHDNFRKMRVSDSLLVLLFMSGCGAPGDLDALTKGAAGADDAATSFEEGSVKPNQAGGAAGRMFIEGDAASDTLSEAGEPREVDSGAHDDGAVAKPPVGPSPDASARMKCTGTAPISCHFGGQPGNYDVTVVLGGSTAASTMVQAETERLMLNATSTAAGQTQRFTFTVNVRQPEGQPIQDVPAGTPGLDLYFLGNANVPPALDSIGFAPAANPLMVYLAGDSTVCDQTDSNYAGWGQMLPASFDYPVSVANYADSGESSTSFLRSASLFGAITSRLKAGDWVLIQLGHNDKTTTATEFHDNMTKLVTGVKDKGAFPVLVTPVARAQFNGNVVAPQHINGTGANLPQIIKQVATEQKVPMLDLLARTVTWLTELGPKGWQPYHALGTDATHTNRAGAAVEAGFVRDLVQSSLPELAGHLR
jgi:lysophospholipase L1-like esterase